MVGASEVSAQVPIDRLFVDGTWYTSFRISTGGVFCFSPLKHVQDGPGDHPCITIP